MMRGSRFAAVRYRQQRLWVGAAERYDTPYMARAAHRLPSASVEESAEANTSCSFLPHLSLLFSQTPTKYIVLVQSATDFPLLSAAGFPARLSCDAPPGLSEGEGCPHVPVRSSGTEARWQMRASATHRRDKQTSDSIMAGFLFFLVERSRIRNIEVAAKLISNQKVRKEAL